MWFVTIVEALNQAFSQRKKSEWLIGTDNDWNVGRLMSNVKTGKRPEMRMDVGSTSTTRNPHLAISSESPGMFKIWSAFLH